MIRDANPSDLPCLAAAMVRLQEAHVQAFPEIYRHFDVDEAAAHLSELLSDEDAFVRVAEQGGAIAGHVVLLVKTRPESMFAHEARFGLIAQIEVDPQFRRQGHGRALLEDCERISTVHGLHRILLDVWAFNQTAKSFFQELGYEEFGTKMSRSI